jgi:glycosyltransferase involved in cell wall biosynthesis
MLQSIPNTTPRLAMAPRPDLGRFDCRVYSFAEMAAYYDSLLAMVIPGRRDVSDYFVGFKMRCNFFSTKAAEALSRGVPLLVSSELVELAEFVKEHGCGAVYSPASHRYVFPTGDWIGNRSEWERLTMNARNVGESFTRHKVLGRYVAAWESCVAPDRQRRDEPPDS